MRYTFALLVNTFHRLKVIKILYRNIANTMIVLTALGANKREQFIAALGGISNLCCLGISSELVHICSSVFVKLLIIVQGT